MAGKTIDYIEWGYNKNNPTWYKDLAVYQSGVEKSYEPFNPTPLEALEVSPDYPRKIYDLSDVTVTSRGRNLFDENILLNQGFIKQSDGIFYANFAAPTYGKVIWENTEGYTGQLKIMFSGKWNEGATGGGAYPSIYYTDGSILKIPFGAYGQWVEKSIVTASGKIVGKIQWDYGTNITQTWIRNFAVYKNEEWASDEFSFFDKYRCTEAEVPVTLRSCEEDKDYIVSDGSAVKWNACVKELIIDGTVNNFVCNVSGTAGDQRCQFYVKNNAITYDRLKQGSVMKNSHGFATQVKAEGSNYLPYIIIPWAVLGLTSTPTAAEATEAAKSYCAARNAAGNPLVIRYVLNTPIITDCTDEAWAQDLLDLKTAPYYTKLYADKETGGLRSFYKTFQARENEVLTGYLLTSDGEYVVTNDGKTVIQF